MNIPIIFEDEYILVIDKPEGVVVNKSETQRGETVQDWVLKRYKIDDLRIKNEEEKESSEFEERGGIVHRLDKGTSGVMVIAKTPEAFINLQAQFKKRGVKKEYIALVHGAIEGEGLPVLDRVETRSGKVQGSRFRVNAPIARNPNNRTKQAVVEGGRDAETEFEIVEKFAHPKTGEKFTLVKAYPKTGRMHQIRVHLTALNHPIVSDLLYTGRRRFRIDIKWLPRMFLHAQRLEFEHPVSGERVSFESKLPSLLENILKDLRFKN